MPGTIMIIDDDKDMQKLYGLYLKNKGFRVIQAEDGQKAKEMITAEIPDLLIVDIWMPHMDGLQFITWLKAEGKIERPVIVLTAVQKKDLEAKLKAAGVRDIFYKPVQIKRLISAIEANLTPSLGA